MISPPPPVYPPTSPNPGGSGAPRLFVLLLLFSCASGQSGCLARAQSLLPRASFQTIGHTIEKGHGAVPSMERTFEKGQRGSRVVARGLWSGGGVPGRGVAVAKGMGRWGGVWGCGFRMGLPWGVWCALILGALGTSVCLKNKVRQGVGRIGPRTAYLSCSPPLCVSPAALSRCQKLSRTSSSQPRTAAPVR